MGFVQVIIPLEHDRTGMQIEGVTEEGENEKRVKVPAAWALIKYKSVEFMLAVEHQFIIRDTTTISRGIEQKTRKKKHKHC